MMVKLFPEIVYNTEDAKYNQIKSFYIVSNRKRSMKFVQNLLLAKRRFSVQISTSNETYQSPMV